MPSESAMNRRQALVSGAAGLSLATATSQQLLAQDTKPEDGERFELNYLLPSCMYGYSSLAEILPEVSKIGASGIDLWPKVHGNQREQASEMGEAAFSALLKKNQTSVECITQYQLGPFGLADEFRYAQRIGCKTIVTGAVGPRGLTGRALKTAVGQFIEKLKPHLAAAEESGVTIAIENHGNNLIESPDSLKWLMELRPSDNLKIALAPYHLPQDSVILSDLIRSLGDSMAIFYAWQYGMGCMEKLPKSRELLQMPGRGRLNFVPLLAALKDIKFRGWTEIFMHPVPRGLPILDSTASVTAEINRSRSYLSTCLKSIEDQPNSRDNATAGNPGGKPKMTVDKKQTQKIIFDDYNKLNQREAYVILNQGTEPAGPGGYTMTKDPGTYICRQCNAQLYKAEDKFESHCGWPSFDDEIEGAVIRRVDKDGYRVEIVCSNCKGHLGHVFEGERMTAKNTRHCVNSISMKFIKKGQELPAKIVKKKD